MISTSEREATGVAFEGMAYKVKNWLRDSINVGVSKCVPVAIITLYSVSTI
jgi:hypothetical protein